MEKILEVAIESALGAGKIVKEGFGTNFLISNKEGINNLVTEYDTKSEEYIISNIKKAFPNHQFLAEESGKTNQNRNNEITWVIDPLDGTVNFAHALPIFSVSIAAELDGEILCGVIYHPILDQLFYAEKGGGSFMNEIKIHVSKKSDFRKSFLVTGFPYNVSQNPCNCIDHFVQIIKDGIPVRRLGSAALDLAYVAAGIFDGFWEVNLNPWDVAAGAILVEEAGGTVTEYSRSRFTIQSQTILATNGILHNEISDTLMKCGCNSKL